MPGPITIPVILQNVSRAASTVGGAGTALAGSATSSGGRINTAMFGQGGPGEIVKGLGQIAKQLPGAGMMEGMAGAFKQGGPIGVITAGVSGMLGFVKQIMESSKVFQGIAGSFFKIFGAMADVFLLPFLPLAMRGMQMLMQHIPMFSEAGAKTAAWIEQFITDVRTGGFWNTVSPLLGKLQNWFLFTAIPALGVAIREATKWTAKNIVASTNEQGDVDVSDTIVKWGKIASYANPMTLPGRFAGTKIAGALGFGGDDDTTDAGLNQLGGIIPGGPGAAVSATLHGGELVVPSDVVGQMQGAQAGVGMFLGNITQSLAEGAEAVQTFAIQHEQKQMGPGGDLARFDDAVIRGHLPNTWDDISSIYQQMEDETATEAKAAEMAAGNIVNPLDGFDPGFDKITNEIERTLSTLSLGDFVLDSSVADEINNCFTIANQCVNAQWTSLADLVENGVHAVQMGVDGDILDVEAIHNLVEQGRALGGAPAALANSLASRLETAIQALADPAIPDTSAAEIQSMIDEMNSLQTQINSTLAEPKFAFKKATQAVVTWTDEWRNTWSGSDDDTPWGWMYGGIGNYYGAGASQVSGLKGFIRKNEVICGETHPWQSTNPDGLCYTKPIVPPVAQEEEYYEEDDGGWTPPEPPDPPAVVDVPSGIHEVGSGSDSGPSAESFADYGPPEGGFQREETPNYAEAAWMDDYYSRDPLSDYFTGRRGSSGRRGGVSSTRVMNVNINTRATVQDIIGDLARIDHMDETSFFNGV